MKMAKGSEGFYLKACKEEPAYTEKQVILDGWMLWDWEPWALWDWEP